jgi:hypothetical protein
MSARKDILAAGLRWLYETEQPDGAILQHHGVWVGKVDNRSFSFAASAWEGRAVVVAEVVKVEWKSDPLGHQVPANPLAPEELADLTAELVELGAEVLHTWNGHPAITGSLALARPAHPSLVAAVDRYRTGCPDHTGPLCSWDGCPWYGDGNALIIKPAVASEVTA